MSNKPSLSKNHPAARENKTVIPESKEQTDVLENDSQLSHAVQLGMAHPDRLAPPNVITLQRAIGNRAVSRLIQARLKVGAADDPYEREADRVAEQVVHMPQPERSGQSSLQRQEDEEELQMTPILQRQEEEEEIQMERTDPMGAFEAGADFEKRLESARGGGQPLPGEVRDFMEPRFSADFSGVRLHTGSEAADLNRQVGARAFTQGRDIYLGQGEENLQSEQGRTLLAHELTHVTQQTGSQAMQLATIQRFMSLADWKKHSSLTFGRRSAGLKRIDALVGQYNAIPKDKTSLRLQTLSELEQAISDWKAEKGGSSARMEAVNDLLRDIKVESQALKIEMEQTEDAPLTTQAPEVDATEGEGDEGDEELRQLEAELESGEGADLSPEEAKKLQDEMNGEELETLRMMIMAQRAIIEGLKTRHAMAKDLSPEMVEDLLEEIREAIEEQERISDALSRPRQDDPDGDKSAEAELQEMLQGLDTEEDIELRKLEAELEAEEVEGKAEFGGGFEVDDPEDVLDQLAEAEDNLRNMEEDARLLVLRQAQEGKIIGALLPLFMAYKTKKDQHGEHGIKSERAQEIIDQMMGKPEFDELYALDPQKGDAAIQKAAEMAFGDTWTIQVIDAELSVVNIDTDAALKQAVAPVRAECETIAKAGKEKLEAAFEVLAQAQLEAKKSGERSLSTGPIDTTIGGSVTGYMGAKGTAKVSAEIDKLAKSIKAVAEASAQVGMGADMAGFIRAGYGKHLELSAEANLSAFFGVKGSASAEFEATLRGIRAEAMVSAMAGLEVSGGANVKVRLKNTDITLDAEGEALAGAKADLSGSVTIDTSGISLKGSAEAFVGVKASGSIGGSVGYKGKKMFSVRAKAEALAGAGANASAEFTFHQGKLHLSAEAGVALGLGASTGTEIEIDFKVIGEAVLAEIKEFYDLIFPPEIDRRSPDGTRPTGLSSESRGKLYMAIYPALVKYGQKKQKQGEHGIKREVLQALLDKHVILNPSLVQDLKWPKDATEDQPVPLYKFEEADEVLIFAALSALAGQLTSINIQAGQIRSMDAVAKEAYVGLT